MIPILYNKNEKIFNTLGLGALKDCIDPLVTEERNGLFYLEMKYPVDGINFDEIIEENIIVADASHDLKNQRFVITRITEPLNGIVSIYAEHISSYITYNSGIKSVNFEGDGSTGLEAWKNAVICDKKFTTYSNITTMKSGSWGIDKVPNARAALGGVEGSLLDLYGGEYKFDNMHVQLLKGRGADRGARVDYGKNLTAFERDIDITDTYTSIIPYATIQEAKGEGEYVEKLITLPEHILHHESVKYFSIAKTKAVDFSSKNVNDIKALRKEAERYLKNNQPGEPKVRVKLSFVELKQTLNYANSGARKDTIGLCDTITFTYEKYKIYNLKMKVTVTEWDVTRERYNSLVIGSLGTNFRSNVITAGVDDIAVQLDNMRKDINNVRVSADGKNLTFTGSDEPVANNVGDKWFKENEEGTYDLLIWDGIKWTDIVSEKIFKKLNQGLEENKKLIDETSEKSEQMIKDMAAKLDEDKVSLTDMDGIIRNSGDNIALALKYKGGDIKTAINLSKDGVVIKGDQVSITGDTYIERGIIKSAHIADGSINNAKIGNLTFDWAVGKTLNASQVNVINLDANNITSGYLLSYRLRVVSDFEMMGNAIRFTNAGNLSTIIDREKIHFYDQANNARYVGNIGAVRLLDYPGISMMNLVHRAGSFMSIDYYGTDKEGNLTNLPYIIFDAYKEYPFLKDTYDIKFMKKARFTKTTTFDDVSYWTKGNTAVGMKPFDERTFIGNTETLTGLMIWRSGQITVMEDGKGLYNLHTQIRP